MVWIHGGGWRNGSRKRLHLRELAKHGFAMASISYRFTDKAIFPAQYVSADDPPLLVFQGAKDKTVLPDQSERIVDLYHEANLPAKLVILEKAGHGGTKFYTGEHLQTAIDFLKHNRP